MKKIAAFVFLALSAAVYPCTDFILMTKEGGIINGRSLDFALDLQASLKFNGRNQRVTSGAPANSKGMQWTSKYGFISINPFNSDVVLDGLNEAGLSFGALWLPGTEYQDVAINETANTIDFGLFGSWVLGNFSTVAEIKKALNQIQVWGHAIPEMEGVPTVHFAMHDAKGNSLVIEFIKGEMQVFNNPTGVLTNFPPFEWQVTNLQNYIQLSPINAKTVIWKGIKLAQTGQGSGLVGIPGDWTPPSRFVRISTFIRFADQAETALDGVNLAEHFLNTVDIPLGDIQEENGQKVSKDYAQWAVVKDLENRLFYFRSYKDLALKFIDLKGIDFAKRSQKQPLPLTTPKGYIDMTDALQ